MEAERVVDEGVGAHTLQGVCGRCLGNRLEGERVVDESVGADALECIGRSRVGDAVERNVAHCHPFRNGNHFHYDATVRKIATESNRYKRVHT